MMAAAVTVLKKRPVIPLDLHELTTLSPSAFCDIMCNMENEGGRRGVNKAQS
jgi:DNA-binding PucR family transcriptional regulator